MTNKLLRASILASAICQTAFPAGETVMNIFFIGNSFTQRHYLSLLFKTIAEEGQKNLKVNAEKVTYGGQTLFAHSELYFSHSLLELAVISEDEIKERIRKMQALLQEKDSPEFYKNFWKELGKAEYDWETVKKNITGAVKAHESWIAKKKISLQPWDYVVLQSWQDITNKENTGYFSYAVKLASLAAAQKTKVILYITAPYAMNQKSVTSPIESEKVFTDLKIAAQLQKKLNAVVVPVGLALYNIQKQGTDLKFRYVNDFHPNQYCAYLTACLFYAAVFNKSPEGLAFNTVTENKDQNGLDPDGGPLAITIDEKTKTYLQKTAWEAVQAFNNGKY